MFVQKGANAFPPKAIPVAAGAESSDEESSDEEQVFIVYTCIYFRLITDCFFTQKHTIFCGFCFFSLNVIDTETVTNMNSLTALSEFCVYFCFHYYE